MLYDLLSFDAFLQDFCDFVKHLYHNSAALQNCGGQCGSEASPAGCDQQVSPPQLRAASGRVLPRVARSSTNFTASQGCSEGGINAPATGEGPP